MLFKKKTVVYLSREILETREKMKKNHKANVERYRELEREGHELKGSMEMREIRAVLKNNHNRNKNFLSKIAKGKFEDEEEATRRTRRSTMHHVQNWDVNTILFNDYMKDVTTFSEKEERMKLIKENDFFLYQWIFNVMHVIKTNTVQRQRDLEKIRFHEIMSLNVLDERIAQLEYFHANINKNLSALHKMKHTSKWKPVCHWKENYLGKFMNKHFVFSDEQVKRLASVGFFYKHGAKKKVNQLLYLI